ncbi:MAG: phosphate ABC transporter substrate-binding protein [Coriobacteriia bacterium]|nr:phosphate ABC transporter substrate-binding protein [Coriobacteriia bacterium]
MSHRPVRTRTAASQLATRLVRLVLACACAACLALLPGCSNGERDLDEIVVTGSTTILPIAEIGGEMFVADNPGFKVLVSGLGSSAGIETVAHGSSDIGTSSRDLKESEMDLGLYDTPIAIDAIAVIVNPSNPIDGLTTEQVRAIFEGSIQNWSEIGGPDRPIGLVNRDEASGTREAFHKIVMGERLFDRSAAVLPGTGQVRSVVAEAPGAIGYISLGFVNGEVKALAIDGVEATPETSADGTYPLQRLLRFFTRGEPEGLAARYIAYVLSADIQETVVRDAGFLPIRGEVSK